MGDGERFQILRPLGDDGATYAARDTGAPGGPRVVVLERVAQSSQKADDRAAAVRRVRVLMPVSNPRIVRVREVIERDDEVLAVSDLVDGEWLAALTAFEPRPPLEISLRLVLDLLDGLAVLHDLRDERAQPRPVIHGALAPDAVLVGLDGVAQVARTCSLYRRPEERYMAPELRQRGGTPPDVRSDIYSVGTILRDVLGAATPEDKWAEPLTEIAWRACSFERESRWPTALTMAAALRRAIGSRVALPAKTAAFARERFGERVRSRRAALESMDGEAPSSVQSLRPSDLEVLADVSDLQREAKTLRPPVPPKAIGRGELAKASVRWGGSPEDEVAGRTTQRGLAPPLRPGGPPPAPPAAVPPGTPPVLAPAVVAPVVTAPYPPAPAAAAPPPPVAAPPPAPAAAPPPAVSAPPAQRVSFPGAQRPAPLGPPPTFEPPVLVQQDLVEPAVEVQLPPTTSDSYRRRLPTLPTADAPPRERFTLQAILVATGMVSTFVIGWWTGHHGVAADADANGAASASAADHRTDVPPPPAPAPPSVTAAASVPPPPSSAPAPSATAAAATTASAAAAEAQPSQALSSNPAPAATHQATATAAPTPPSVAASPDDTPPSHSSTASANPTAARTAATATAPAKSAAPAKSGTGTYSPSEL